MKHWVLATRPATLTAAAVPVAVGTACAWRLTEVRWLPTLAALLGAFLIQIGTNFANDVFDAERGAVARMERPRVLLLDVRFCRVRA